MKRQESWFHPWRVLSVVLTVTGVLMLSLAGPAMAATGSGDASSPSTTVPPTTSTTAAPPLTTTEMIDGGAAAASGSGSASPLAAGLEPHANVGLIGDGSSFAGPEILQWATDVSKSPYNLTINYTADSSGQGRFDFGSGTVDFAVSDIPYQGKAFDTAQPNFPFIYVPVTAGGVAFMYHLNGLASGVTLQLSSYSICAIMSGGVTMWNSPIIQGDNPGVSLPATPIRPVIRSDLAGTNFVLQEYCIHEQPQLWADFVNSTATQQFPGQVGDLSATEPRSDWPLFANAIVAAGSANAADDVADPKDDGYITAVETAYAIQRGSPVASVKNFSGKYTQPSAVGVASALAYASQNANGTHNLDFDGAGPYVYNPSTYSYLLTPTKGWTAAKGDTLSQFVNYALTLGQQQAPEIGYASLGLSLEQYGVNAVQQNVPGAVPILSSETAAYQCGDLTPPEVQAGQQSPTCGVVNTNNSSTPGTTAKGGGGSTSSPAAKAATAKVGTASKAATGTSSATSGAGGSGGTAGGAAGTGGSSSSGGTVSAGVTLGGTSPSLPTTGWSPLPVVILGFLFVVGGWVLRRRLATRLR